MNETPAEKHQVVVTPTVYRILEEDGADMSNFKKNELLPSNPKIQLRPCPFCGAPGAFDSYPDDSINGRWKFLAHCSADCEVNPIAKAWSHESAARIWNGRAADEDKA